MRTRTIPGLIGLALLLGVAPQAARAAAAFEIYGAWHCGNDYCTWRFGPDGF